MNRLCANCGVTAPEKEQMYSIRIELFARAEPLSFDAETLFQDNLMTLNQLIQEMEKYDPQELEDQVHESYTFSICAKCRTRMHQQLKSKAQSTQSH